MKLVIGLMLLFAAQASFALEDGRFVKAGPDGNFEVLVTENAIFPLNAIVGTQATLTKTQQVGGPLKLLPGDQEITIVATPTQCRITYYGPLTREKYYKNLNYTDIGMSVEAVELDTPNSAIEYENCRSFVNWINESLKKMEHHLYMTVGARGEFRRF